MLGRSESILALSCLLGKRWDLGVGVLSACPWVHPALLWPGPACCSFSRPGLGTREDQFRKQFMPQTQGTRWSWGGAAGGT